MCSNKAKIARIASFILVMIFAFVSYVPVFADESGIKVMVDDRQLVFEVQPTVINGRTMVPLRAIFEALGATVEWDAQTKGIRGIKGGTTIQLMVGSPNATVDGKEITLDVPAMIIDGRTLVPVRFISESLGAEVGWDAETKTVSILPPEEPDSGSKASESEDSRLTVTAGVSIDYGVVDKWVYTLSSYFPSIVTTDTLYKNQSYAIPWIFAGFGLDASDYARITCDINIYSPDGTAIYTRKGIIAVNKPALADDYILGGDIVELRFGDNDVYGEYRIEITAKDTVANSVYVAESKVTLAEYKQDISHFNNMDEIENFITGYNGNPEPEKLISAFLGYCKSDLNNMVIDIFFAETFLKNEYLLPYLQIGIDTLDATGEARALEFMKLFDQYALLYGEKPSAYFVWDFGEPQNNVAASTLWGQFFATGSIVSVENLVIGLGSDNYTATYEESAANTPIPGGNNPAFLDFVEKLKINIQLNEYVRAYCEYLYHYGDLRNREREELARLLQGEFPR